MTAEALKEKQGVRGRILVVDDDANALDILTRMVLHEGYECLAASSGPGALELLKAEPVDVILLDVLMPEMTGLEVCEHLHRDERLRRIPVILVTALDDMETRSSGMKLGVSEYITKPINRLDLFKRIRAQMHALEIDRQLSVAAATVSDDFNI